MNRIAIAGLQHETNTFAPLPTDLKRFLTPDAWPEYLEGEKLLDALAGKNIPAAGFSRAMAGKCELLPLLWCSAGPGGVVTDRAFEWIWRRLLERLRDAMPIDGLYLDLHGAMVTESHDDAEGELLRRLRTALGNQMPIVASLDFHANTTAGMLTRADALVGYRTYPHIDMDETGARAAKLLVRCLTGARMQKAFAVRLPMTALVWQNTSTAPMRSIIEQAMRAEDGGCDSVSVFAGFPLADIPDAGASVVAYGTSESHCRRTVRRLAEKLRTATIVQQPVYSATDAVAAAREHERTEAGLLILADVEDNPGAGGSADTVTLLRVMCAGQLRNAVAGVICDPEAAVAAHRAGVGSRVKVGLGGKSGLRGESPLTASFEVLAVGDGRFAATGPFYKGCRMNLGPMACLRLNGVSIIVSSRPQQAADRAMFRHVGIDPDRHSIVALKSTVHFRADFEPIAHRILIVAANGQNPIDLTTLPYRRYSVESGSVGSQRLL